MSDSHCIMAKDIVRTSRRREECGRNARTNVGHRMSYICNKCLKSNGGAYYGRLGANGNRADSVMAKGGLTASRT